MATLTSIVIAWANPSQGNTYMVHEFHPLLMHLLDENGAPYTAPIDPSLGIFMDTHRASDGVVVSTSYRPNSGTGNVLFDETTNTVGSYYLTGRVGNVVSNQQPVTIIAANLNPTISLSPSSLAWGTARNVVVSFNGYMPDNLVDWSFDGVDRTFLNTDSTGHASATISASEVSNLAPGSHVIKGTDFGTGISKTATLSITGSIPSNPSIHVSPATIAEGHQTEVTITGGGFIGDQAVSLYYDNNPIVGLQNVPVNSNGTFSYVDNVDAQAGSSGQHKIKAVGAASTGHQAETTLTIGGVVPTPFPNPFPNLDPNLVTAAVIIVGGGILGYLLLRETRGEREIIRDRVRG